MRIYLASPISGMSYDEVAGYYQSLSGDERLAKYEILHPMTGKNALRTELVFRAKDYRYPVATNHAIYERDQWMVRQADIVLADLSNARDRVSIGCCMELAWASILGKHTVVVLPQEDNIHQHAFVLEAADVIFKDIDETLDYLSTLIN